MSMDDKENALIFDTHAHYDDEAFDKDRESVIASLPAGGIGTAVDVASTAASIPIVVRIAEEHEHLLAAVGVHPSECAEMSQKDMDLIEEMLKHPKVKAIGEIGLDYHWPEPERSIQKKWFSRQLDLALKTDMPVIIHSRDAAEDTYICLREFCRKRKDAGLSGSPGVIHCYSYSPEQAREYVKMGFYIGIGGALTFKNSKKLRTVAQVIISAHGIHHSGALSSFSVTLHPPRSCTATLIASTARVASSKSDALAIEMCCIFSRHRKRSIVTNIAIPIV